MQYHCVFQSGLRLLHKTKEISSELIYYWGKEKKLIYKL